VSSVISDEDWDAYRWRDRRETGRRGSIAVVRRVRQIKWIERRCCNYCWRANEDTVGSHGTLSPLRPSNRGKSQSQHSELIKRAEIATRVPIWLEARGQELCTV
jgi:hypothetical protein